MGNLLQAKPETHFGREADNGQIKVLACITDTDKITTLHCWTNQSNAGTQSSKLQVLDQYKHVLCYAVNQSSQVPKYDHDNIIVEQSITTTLSALNSQQTRTKLLRCDSGRMELQHVSCHTALPCKFFQAQGTNISFDTRVGC